MSWLAAFLNRGQGWLEVNNLSFVVGLIWWGLLMALTLITIRRQQAYTQSLAHKNLYRFSNSRSYSAFWRWGRKFQADHPQSVICAYWPPWPFHRLFQISD